VDTLPDSSAAANDGEVVRVFNNVPPEKLAVIDQVLTGGSVPDGPLERKAWREGRRQGWGTLRR
jgi:hypothetical protein